MVNATNKGGRARRGATLAGLIAVAPIAFAGTIYGWGANQGGVMTGIPAGSNFSKVSSFEQHAVALRNDGLLVGWGADVFGETIMPAGTYADIAAGQLTSYAIRADGSIAAWGYNGYGQISGAPTSGSFTKISAGRLHATALRSDGTAIAWGYSSGNGVGTFVDVSSGLLDWSLGVRQDGTLYAWGVNNAYNQFNVPAGNDFVAAAAGSFHGVAIRANGSLVAWGKSHSGQLAVPAGNNFIAVAAGHDHSIALRSDGSLAAWGYNGSNQNNVNTTGVYTSLAAGNQMHFAVGLVPEPATVALLGLAALIGLRRR